MGQFIGTPMRSTSLMRHTKTEQGNETKAVSLAQEQEG